MSRKSKVVYCNCCGRRIGTEEQEGRISFLTIRKEWGYFSDKKDGTIHSMDICEPCYDKLVESFTIPPEIEQITEYL